MRAASGHVSERTTFVHVALIAALVAACGPSAKKKVASAEDEKFEEPAPRWESAGETEPPEKPIEPDPSDEPPPSALAESDAEPARAAPGNSRSPAKGAAAKRSGGARGSSQSSRGLVAEDELLAPPITFESPDAPGGRVGGSTRAREPLPLPEPRAERRPELPPRPSARIDPDPEPPRRSSRDRDYDEPPSRSPSGGSSGSGGTIHGYFSGKKITFPRATILGNTRHGFAIRAFEIAGDPSSGEINVRIDGDLLRGRSIPIKLIHLQIADDGRGDPKERNIDGARVLDCQGRGELYLDSAPAIPRRFPRDEVEIGDASGELSINVICSRASREFGAFIVGGRVVARVIVTPPDL